MNEVEDPVAPDEAFKVGFGGAAAADPDDVDSIGELFLRQCDRTGFALTGRSPRRPEPQHEILTRVVTGIELAAAHCLLGPVVGPCGRNRVA